MMIRLIHAMLVVAAATTLAACGQNGTSGSDELRVSGAWSRATAPGQDVGGAFVTIRGGKSPDRLIGGSTPIAQSVEIHSMRMDGSVMRMRRQPALAVAAGASVKLGPGGTHVMLRGLKSPLTQGSSFPLTLEFETAGKKQVEVSVYAIGSSGPKDGDND